MASSIQLGLDNFKEWFIFVTYLRRLGMSKQTYRSEGQTYDIRIKRNGAKLTAKVFDMPMETSWTTLISEGGYNIRAHAFPEIKEDTLYVLGLSGGKDVVAEYTFSCGASNAKEWFNAISGLIDKLNANYTPPKPEPVVWRSKGKPFDIELTRDGATVTAKVWAQPEEKRSKVRISAGGFRISSAASPGIGNDVLYIRGCSTLCDNDVATYTFQCGASNAKEWLDAISSLIDKLNAEYKPQKPEPTAWRSEGRPYDVEFTLDGRELSMTVHGMPEDRRREWTVEGDDDFFVQSAYTPEIAHLGIYLWGKDRDEDHRECKRKFYSTEEARKYLSSATGMIDRLNAEYKPPKPKKITWRSEGKPYDVEITLEGETLTGRTYSTPPEMDNKPAQTTLAGHHGDYSISISCGNTDIYEHTFFLRSKDAYDKNNVSHHRVGDKAKALKSFNVFKTLIDELNAGYTPQKRKATMTELYRLVHEVQKAEYHHGLEVGHDRQSGCAGEGYDACEKAYKILAKELGLTQRYYS